MQEEQDSLAVGTEISRICNSAGMAASDSAFGFVPRDAGGRVLQHVLLSSSQFVALPLMNRDVLRCCRQVVPQILNELKFFRGCKFENRRNGGIHAVISENRHVETIVSGGLPTGQLIL